MADIAPQEESAPVPEQVPVRLPETAPPVAQTVLASPEPAPRPAPAPVSNGVELVLVAPWNSAAFDPSIDGVGIITRDGTQVPAPLADQIIASAAASGVTVERRS